MAPMPLLWTIIPQPGGEGKRRLVSSWEKSALGLRLQPQINKSADGFRLVGNWFLLRPPCFHTGKHFLSEADHLFDRMSFRSTNHFAYA